MKWLVFGISICAAIVVSAGQMKYGVTVVEDKKTDFSAIKTYSWTLGRPSFNTTIDALVIAAVDRELRAIGISKATSGPGDVLVTYSSVSRTEVNVKAKPDSEGKLPQHLVGTLVVGLLDPGSRQRLLQMRIDRPIEFEPASLELTINSAVAALFAQYPTRRGK